MQRVARPSGCLRGRTVGPHAVAKPHITCHDRGSKSQGRGPSRVWLGVRPVDTSRRSCKSIAKAADSNAAAPAKTSEFSALSLFTEARLLFGKVMWPAILLYLASEIARELVSRSSYRLVNHLFLMFSGSLYDASVIGESLWHLSCNPAITTWASGYNVISYSLVALTFPAISLINAAFLLSLYHLAFEVLEGVPPKPALKALPAPAAASDAQTLPPAVAADGTHAAAEGAAGRDALEARITTADAASSGNVHASVTVHATPAAAAGDLDASDAGRALETANSSHAELSASERDRLAAGSVGGAAADGSGDAGAQGAAGNGAASTSQPAHKSDGPSATQQSYLMPATRKERFVPFRRAFGAASEVIRKWLRQVFVTSMLVGLIETGMMGLSCFVVTLPFTVWHFLSVQMALLIARYEGCGARAALEASRKRLAQHKRPFGLAFAAAFIGQFLCGPLQHVVNMVLSPRIALQVPEIPIAAYIGLSYAKFMLVHVQWLIPVVLFHKLKTRSAGHSNNE